MNIRSINLLDKIINFFKAAISRVFFMFFGKFISKPPSVFDNKKIIIIGPAKTVLEELEGINLDDFDIVVRMNRAIDIPLMLDGENHRIDVLFHNFKEFGTRGAGEVTKEKIKRSNTKIIFLPFGGHKKCFPFITSKIKMIYRGINVDLSLIPAEIYSEVRNSINGYSPTTGAIALAYFMKSNFKTLNIVGFTFFKTKYMDNYNNSLKKDEDGYEWAKTRDIHNPKLEAIYFKCLLSNYSGISREIFLGKYVKHSINEIEEDFLND